MPAYPGFIGPSNPSQSRVADQEQTVNLYVEQAQSKGATTEAALFSVPGFNPWSVAVANIGARGFGSAGSRFFAVMGAGLYEYDLNGTPTLRGAVAQDANQAQIIYNGVVAGQLGIASGGNFYSYDLASNVLTAVVAMTGLCTQLGYAHGYFLGFNINTGKVYESALNDGLTWSAGNFFQRSLFADPWQTMFVDGNSLIWLIGTETFEVWNDTGTGTQPFAPLSGLVGRYGIAAPFAYALAGQSPYWISRNSDGAGMLVSARGGAVTPISPYTVATAWSGYQRTSRITDAELLVHNHQGHNFVVPTFPSAMKTWACDVDTQSWTERGAWNTPLMRYDIWAPRVHCYAFGKHLVGSRSSGVICEMDAAYATEFDGTTGIRRMRRAPGLTREHARIPFDSLELLMDVGVGTATGQGANPSIMLRCSDDGGYTWGNQRTASLGRIGEYRKRVKWDQLGTSQDRVFEVSVSDPVPVRFSDAWLNVKEGQRAA